MRVHLIVDFQYNYYRNKFSFERTSSYGHSKRLSSIIDGEEVDTTYMYMTLKDIESYRKMWETNRDGSMNEVTVSIAADSKSDRKEMDTEYKSNRGGKLDSDDYESIERTLETLNEVGYNVYKREGWEADDIIRGLVQNFEDSFDVTIIHTNDSDILVNLGPKVAVARFKSSLRKHVLITEQTFSEIMGAEFKCEMPLNTILLYKSLVGDKSDKVAGVKGFGPKAFDKLIDILSEMHDIEYFRNLKYKENTEKCLKECYDIGRLSDIQFEEAMHSFDLVKYKELEFVNFNTPVQKDSNDSRAKAYLKYEMKTLIV
jgi:5'-3' exonuclease